MVEAGIFLLVLGDLGPFFDVQPVVEEIAQLRLSTRVLHHALSLQPDLGGILELTSRGGLQERGVGNGIPQRQREARGDGVIILRADAGVQEGGVGEREDEGALGGDFRGDAGGVDRRKVSLLLVVQRAAVRHLGEAQGEGLELFAAVRRVSLGTRESEQVRTNHPRDLQRAFGDGLRPLSRDRSAALVADAAVVRRQRHGDHADRRRRFRRKVRAGNHRPGAAGRTPFEPQRSGLVLILEELELERVAASAEEEDRRGGRARHGRAHPDVDEGVLFAAVLRSVNVEADAVGRRDPELILAGVRHMDRTAPVDGELRGEATLLGGLIAKVEINDRIDLLLVGDFWAILVRLLGIALRSFAVSAGQPARLGRGSRVAERSEEVRDALAVLADGEVREFDTGRMITGAGLAGIESLVDVFGGGGGVSERQGAGVVLGHLAGDVLGQRSDGFFSDEGFIGLAGDALADRSVTTHTVLAVDDFAGARSGEILLIVALALAAGENQGGEDDERGHDLDGPGKGHGVVTPNLTGKFL